MTPEREQIVGIVGGMGPEATLDLMQRILAATQLSTTVTDDQDHLRMLVDNNPKVPSRIAAIIDGTGADPLPVLCAMAQGLEQQGADFLVMPCNTAHHYYAGLAASVSIPFLNLMVLVAERIERDLPPRPAGAEPPRVGLLASSALGHIKLYEPCFEPRGMQLVYPEPDRQAVLMQLIKNVKARRQDEAGITAFNAAAVELGRAGVDCLLIACTELSVIASELHSNLPVFDAAQILADAVVARVKSPAT